MIRFVDVTCLDEQVTDAELTSLCLLIRQAPQIPAAICVYTQHLTFVKKALSDISLGSAAVINFPQGHLPFNQIVSQIDEAIAMGATELDVVLPYASFLQERDLAKVKNFVMRCRQHMGEQTIFKLILETGAIEDLDAIYELSKTACEAGVDFIKTSTGKIAKGATLQASASILRAIRDSEMQHQHLVGIKVSGGIKTLEQAELFYQQASEVLGELTPQLFRIGASQLFKTIAFAKA